MSPTAKALEIVLFAVPAVAAVWHLYKCARYGLAPDTEE